MSSLDRVTLLLALINNNGESDSDLFEMLVPTYDIELYTLYSILDDTNTKDECIFRTSPSSEDGLLYITINSDSESIEKIMSHIDSFEYSFEYITDRVCSVQCNSSSDGILDLILHYEKPEQEQIPTP